MAKLLKGLTSASFVMSLIAGPVYEACQGTKTPIPLHYAPNSPTEKRLESIVDLVNNAIRFYEKNGLKASLKVFQNQKGD